MAGAFFYFIWGNVGDSRSPAMFLCIVTWTGGAGKGFWKKEGSVGNQ
jgi:hypothetical protein